MSFHPESCRMVSTSPSRSWNISVGIVCEGSREIDLEVLA